MRQINDIIKRVRLAKAHTLIINYLRSAMPKLGKEKAQQVANIPSPNVFVPCRRRRCPAECAKSSFCNTFRHESCLQPHSIGAVVVAPQTVQCALPAGPGVLQRFALAPHFVMDADHVYQVQVHSAAPAGAVLSSHISLHMPPKDLHLAPAALVTEVLPPRAAKGNSIAVVVSSNATALYVTLTCAAQGRFADNAFTVSQSLRLCSL